jgi:hypothetical protein
MGRPWICVIVKGFSLRIESSVQSVIKGATVHFPENIGVILDFNIIVAGLDLLLITIASTLMII